ncbi:Non-specific serine/threonine protein kinase [Vibrio chagasii]|nr:Non-specific serine/threonine protein kinase [Vibrio chagasii]CAH6849456.1 Non-specific serine/threonine protein kinase [Vibrio chagasii]CAH6854339.1 Non-specific serine/threonine protein kinase [Vibrio chagasii]CAH7054897.1 Non-specific serine/threonine protein kinase [Vibrio chagasii]CAH7096507.1 Non-specific serine/threonine protein kinase [Vibrio chagasii]
MNQVAGLFLSKSNKQLGERYYLLECLGDGTHGWVYRAERINDKKIVALKIPKQNSAPDRTLAEGKDLIGLEPHPNVIQVYDMGRIKEENNLYVIEMEYFPSETLAQKLENRDIHLSDEKSAFPYNQYQCVAGNSAEYYFNIYEQVLKAVDYLSQLEPPISHGDIKPHNILVGDDNLVKLTDFGSSALPLEFYVKTRENGGTVLYSAPEFCDCASRKGTTDQLIAGDIYSLGVLLYQLMTGTLPHSTQVDVRKHAPFAKPSELNSSVCPEIEAVILKCLDKQPNERYLSVTQLSQAFQQAKVRQLCYAAPKLANTPHQAEIKTDWSSSLTEALSEGDYKAAAKIANNEFKHNQNSYALLMQCHAIYQDERWKEFERLIIDNKDTFLISEDTDIATARIVAIKAMLKWRNIDLAQELLSVAKQHTPNDFDVTLCSASLLGLNAKYPEARQELEELNRAFPRQNRILSRLIQVCEQLRDYSASAGYLRVLLKVVKSDEKLLQKRAQYERLGVW